MTFRCDVLASAEQIASLRSVRGRHYHSVLRNGIFQLILSKLIMKTLVLMRHAKSSWADEGLTDHERPLNDRGLRTVPLMANWLNAHELSPDAVLCSSARRTVETTELLGKSGLKLPKYNPISELYLAPASKILDLIAGQAPPETTKLLVVGHNPGLEELTSMLAEQFLAMPTAAVAVFRLPQDDWKVRIGDRIELVDFVVPRSLDSKLADD